MSTEAHVRPQVPMITEGAREELVVHTEVKVKIKEWKPPVFSPFGVPIAHYPEPYPIPPVGELETPRQANTQSRLEISP